MPRYTPSFSAIKDTEVTGMPLQTHHPKPEIRRKDLTRLLEGQAKDRCSAGALLQLTMKTNKVASRKGRGRRGVIRRSYSHIRFINLIKENIVATPFTGPNTEHVRNLVSRQ